jgi:hypothetical protein
MRRFASDDRGNVAVLFALTLVPLTGLAGAAFDYSRANEFRTFTLKLSDEIALAAAVSDDPEARTTLVGGGQVPESRRSTAPGWPGWRWPAGGSTTPTSR